MRSYFMNYVTLIHPFEVNINQEQEFLNAWNIVDKYMTEQKGFIKTKLYRSLSDPNAASVSFTNVAVWQSSELFMEAISQERFKLISREVLTFSSGPKLYQVFYQAKAEKY